MLLGEKKEPRHFFRFRRHNMGDSRRKRSGNETQDDALADPPEAAPKRRKLNADPYAEIHPGRGLPELPAEVWASILEFVTDPPDAGRCAQVCKRWNVLTEPVKRRMDWELWWLPALEGAWEYEKIGEYFTNVLGIGVGVIVIENRLPFPWTNVRKLMSRPDFRSSIEVKYPPGLEVYCYVPGRWASEAPFPLRKLKRYSLVKSEESWRPPPRSLLGDSF